MEFLKGGILNLCIFSIKTTNLFGLIPIKWNNSKQKFESVAELKSARIRHRFYVSCIYLFGGVLQVFWKWEEADPFVKAFGGSLIATIITTVPPAYVALTQSSQVANMLNSMTRFERYSQEELIYPTINTRANTTFEGKCVVNACKMIAMALTYVQIIFCGVVMMNPCFPTFTGYWLAPQCQETLGLLTENHWSPVEILMRIIIAAIGFTCWIAIVPPTGLLTCFAVLKAFCVCSYIQIITKRLVNATHYNERSMETCKMLRKIQLILLQFRELYSSLILVTFACGGILSQIMFLYTSIDLYRTGLADQQPVWLIACAWGGITYVIAILILYGNLAKVYENSVTLHDDVRTNYGMMKNKWHRRFLKSVPVLRIYLGRYNFIDKGTPTTMEEFVVDQLISLLLLED